MKLYICYGTYRVPGRPGGHPCRNAYRALKDAGHDPDVARAYGLAILPSLFNRTRGRREVARLTGNRWVPTLVLDDGTTVDGGAGIVAWAKANPA